MIDENTELAAVMAATTESILLCQGAIYSLNTLMDKKLEEGHGPDQLAVLQSYSLQFHNLLNKVKSVRANHPWSLARKK